MPLVSSGPMCKQLAATCAPGHSFNSEQSRFWVGTCRTGRRGLVFTEKQSQARKEREHKLTKRVMREVLPTLCSPRKTSLNFLSGDEATYSPPGVGVAAEDIARWRRVGDGGAGRSIGRRAGVRGGGNGQSRSELDTGVLLLPVCVESRGSVENGDCCRLQRARMWSRPTTGDTRGVRDTVATRPHTNCRFGQLLPPCHVRVAWQRLSDEALAKSLLDRPYVYAFRNHCN